MLCLLNLRLADMRDRQVLSLVLLVQRVTWEALSTSSS